MQKKGYKFHTKSKSVFMFHKKRKSVLVKVKFTHQFKN